MRDGIDRPQRASREATMWIVSETPPSVSDRFAHIMAMIDAIERGLLGVSDQEFAVDEFRNMAVERMLEIIGVASDHIPPDIKAKEPDVDWKSIAEMSLRLENPLDPVDPDILLSFAREILPPLRTSIARRTS